MTKARLDSIEEYDIRQWFLGVELEQAVDTYRVVGGIIEARLAAKPTRKRRSDVGMKRKDDQEVINLRELGTK